MSGTEPEYAEREALLDELLEQIKDHTEARRTRQEEVMRQQRARHSKGERICEVSLVRKYQDAPQVAPEPVIPSNSHEDVASSSEPRARQRSPNLRVLAAELLKHMTARERTSRHVPSLFWFMLAHREATCESMSRYLCRPFICFQPLRPRLPRAWKCVSRGDCASSRTTSLGAPTTRAP